jgi:hypothetical protein
VKGGWKYLDTQTFGGLCIKLGILFFTIVGGAILICIFVLPSQNPLFDIRKIENELFTRRK